MYLYPGWASVTVGSLLREHLANARDEDVQYTDLSKEKIDMVEDLMIKGELINQVITICFNYVIFTKYLFK